MSNRKILQLGVAGIGIIVFVWFVMSIPAIVGYFTMAINTIWGTSSAAFWLYWNYLGWLMKTFQPTSRKPDPADDFLFAFMAIVPLVIAFTGTWGAYQIVKEILRFLRALACIPACRIFFGTWPFYQNRDVWAYKRKFFDNELLLFGQLANNKFEEEAVLKDKIHDPNRSATLDDVKAHEKLVREIRGAKRLFFTHYDVLLWMGAIPWLKYDLRRSVTDYQTDRLPPWSKKKA